MNKAYFEVGFLTLWKMRKKGPGLFKTVSRQHFGTSSYKAAKIEIAINTGKGTVNGDFHFFPELIRAMRREQLMPLLSDYV